MVNFFRKHPEIVLDGGEGCSCCRRHSSEPLRAMDVGVTPNQTNSKMYDISVRWETLNLVVTDRYSNLRKLYEENIGKIDRKVKPVFPPKLLIHTRWNLSDRQNDIRWCLEFLFREMDIGALLEYLVGTGLDEKYFSQVSCCFEYSSSEIDLARFPKLWSLMDHLGVPSDQALEAEKKRQKKEFLEVIRDDPRLLPLFESNTDEQD